MFEFYHQNIIQLMILDLSISNSFFAMIPYVCLQSRNDSPTCTDFLPVAFTFKQRLLQSRTKNAFYPLGFAIFCNVLVYYGMSWPYLYHKHPNVQQEMRSNMSQNIHTSKIRYPSVECVGANYYDVCARLLQQNMSACHSGSETTSPHLSLRSSKKIKK